MNRAELKPGESLETDDLQRFRCPFCEREAGVATTRMQSWRCAGESFRVVVHSLPMCASFKTLSPDDYLSFLSTAEQIRCASGGRNDSEPEES